MVAYKKNHTIVQAKTSKCLITLPDKYNYVSLAFMPHFVTVGQLVSYSNGGCLILE